MCEIILQTLRTKVVYIRIILFRRGAQSTDNVFIHKYLFSINYILYNLL